MAETVARIFCGSPEHALDRRGFLGTLAAGAAALAADMTALDVLKSPVLADELKRKQKQRHPALARRRLQPARNLGPQAGRRDRRPVPLDRDRRSRASRSPS